MNIPELIVGKDAIIAFWNAVKKFLNKELPTKQDKLTGAPGQLIGIGDGGAAKATVYPSNPNLLINFDFNIWQRYPDKVYVGSPGNAYVMDKFIFQSSGYEECRIEGVPGGGFRFVSGPSCVMRYRHENASSLNGKTLTLSFLYNNNLLYTNTFVPTEWTDQSDILEAWVNPGDIIYRVKLELGPVQTLAHKEGDTWVLNDPPPDPALELLKCQRYFIRLVQHQLFPSTQISTNYIDFLVPIPATMRTNPTITGDLFIEHVGEANYEDFTFSTVANGPGSLRVRAMKEAHGIPGSANVRLDISEGSAFLDANL